MRNLFKFKILQGVTIFGAGTAYIYKKNSESDSKIVDQKNLELQQQNQELKKDVTDLTEKLNNVNDKLNKVEVEILEIKDQKANILDSVKDVGNQISEISDKLDKVIINNSNKILDNNLHLTSFDAITELYNQCYEYMGNFDLNHQLHLYNVVFTLFLSSLLFDYLVGLYGNYLIEKWDLKNKYPKLAKLIEYRIIYQKYYFKYLALWAVVLLLGNLIFNLYFLFT